MATCKNRNGEYKCDIDSILNEQVKFYTNLFATEGWDKTAGEKLCQFMIDKVSKEYKEMLDRDINICEVEKVLKLLKQNKSPGEDGIISEFYVLYWDIIKDDFFSLLQEIFNDTILSNSQHKGVLTLLHKGGEREVIKNWRPLS